MLRPIGRAFAAFAAIVSFGQAMPVQAAPAWTASADDALLFEVQLSQYRVGDGIRGYQTPEGVCVDFADTLIALDIPIRLDKQLRRAKGWAFAEAHTVDIDRAAGVEHIANSSRQVAPHDIYDTKEGWCVDTRALSRWLGITLTPDTGNAVLVVESATKLPVQTAAERRAKAAAIRPPLSFDLASLPRSRMTTRGIPVPSVDVVASIGGLRDRQSGQRLDVQYEAYVAGHVGPVGYGARLASDRNGLPQTLRVQVDRTEPQGGLLGPLNATTIAIGDVAGASSPLVAASSAGRGALVTNRPIERRERFDKIDLRGELPHGWDAELSRNGQLLAFAQDRADGRYEFLDVPLQYGQNRLEVVLYGPQGQIRRELHNVPVGLDSIPPRKTYYWLGVDEDGHDLINLGHVSSFGLGGWRGSFGLERGLNARTSVAAFAHSLTIDGADRHNYVEASLRHALGSALVEASGSADLGGGQALRVQAIGDLGRTRYDIETIWAKDYRSDRVPANVTGLHTITLDHVFGSARRFLPVDVSARLTTRTTGDDTLDVESRVSATIGRIAITGELAWLEDRHRLLPTAERVDAGLLVNAHVGRVRLRGEARFTVLPDIRLDSADVIGEWSANTDGQIADSHVASWRAELGYDRALSRGRIGIGYVRRFDRLALTATGELASDGSIAAGLNIAFSFGPNPRAGGGVRIVADKLAARGSALVRVYRDVNGNGRHDFGEPWEKGVAVTAGRIPVEDPTDAHGEAVIDGLQPYQPVLIGIDAGSLPDPFVRASIPGIVVTPRPGSVVVVEIPLVGTGEVDGTLTRQGGGTLEGVDLELLSPAGLVVSRTRSDFDGYFLFETVPYGQYTVRIAKLSADAIRAQTALQTILVVASGKPSVHLGALAALPSTRQAAN